MINTPTKTILGIILGLILIFFLTKNCSGNKDDKGQVQVSTPERTVVVKLTTKIDTFTVYKKVFVHDTIEKPTLVRVTDTVFVDGTKVVAMVPAIKREYKDKIRVGDSTAVSYTANTTGTLDKISIEYEDHRAEKTIVRTNNIETTITNTVRPGGLYLGIGSNLGLTELSPSVMYIKDRNAFGVKYNIAGTQTPLQNVGVTYSRRLF